MQLSEFNRSQIEQVLNVDGNDSSSDDESSNSMEEEKISNTINHATSPSNTNAMSNYNSNQQRGLIFCFSFDEKV